MAIRQKELPGLTLRPVSMTNVFAYCLAWHCLCSLFGRNLPLIVVNPIAQPNFIAFYGIHFSSLSLFVSLIKGLASTVGSLVRATIFSWLRENGCEKDLSRTKGSLGQKGTMRDERLLGEVHNTYYHYHNLLNGSKMFI